MKKLFVLLLAGLLLVGCSSTPTTEETTAPETTTAAATEETTETGYSYGVGSVTTVSATDATEDKEGSVTINTTYASVVLNGDTVVEAYFDVAQNKGTYGTDGVIVSAEAAPTKKEKGADYGMKSVSEIGAEVDEQMNSLAAWMVGKTVEEIKNTPVEARDEDHPAVPADETLKASVTITIGDFLQAFEKAVDNAVAYENVAKVGTASVTSLSGSDATEDKDGSVQADTTYAFVGLDADGKVVFANWDVAQNKATFATDGTVVAAEAAPTKVEKGTDYGMKSVSEIGKELDEQIVGLQDYAAGLTVDEFLATPVEAKDEHHTAVPTDETLKTSVTISIGDFLQSFEKAASDLVDVK